MAAWFSITLALSAFLLFVIQPMAGKMLLPLFGGTPAVWNVTMLFFQVTLLLGYIYAFLLSERLPPRLQRVLHVALAGLAFALLGIGALPQDPGGGPPALAVLKLLATLVGGACFVLSTSAPLLQRWLSTTTHKHAKDPYFLYAASNTGSLLALVAYPVLVEPYLALDSQGGVWEIGYAVFAVLLLGCMLLSWRGCASQVVAETHEVIPPPPLRMRLRWIALAAVPSSLMLGLTSHITTDVAPIPLFWVVPLALYLLTFILVFSRYTKGVYGFAASALPYLLLPVMLMLALGGATLFGFALFPFELAAFFLAALVCHGQIAKERPHTRHLALYYVCMALGGAVGGMFNALAAPFLFDSLVEYPLALAAVCLLMPIEGEKRRSPWQIEAALVLAIAAGSVILQTAVSLIPGSTPGMRALVLGMAGVLVLKFCFQTRNVPFRCGLCVGAMVFGGYALDMLDKGIIYADRNFFGTLAVHERLKDGVKLRTFVHGNTKHGLQVQEGEIRLAPTSYYVSTGPVGDVMAYFFGESGKGYNVLGIGLGTGNLACYFHKGDRLTYIEIDPQVEEVARKYFTYLSECPPQTDVVIGDGRMALQALPPEKYDLVIIDAFSSDAIPVHLLTKEAFALYRERLAPEGVVLINFSNRFLALDRVLAGTAPEVGMQPLMRLDLDISEEDKKFFKQQSSWAVLLPPGRDEAFLARYPAWKKLPLDAKSQLWTDAATSLFPLLKGGK